MLTNEKVVTASAWGAISSLAWLPALREVSEICAILAPLLGVVWFLVQIGFKVREELRKP